MSFEKQIPLDGMMRTAVQDRSTVVFRRELSCLNELVQIYITFMTRVDSISLIPVVYK